MDTEQAAQESLTDTYHNAVTQTQEVAEAHVNGLKAVYERAVTETHKFRDELGSAISGSDIEAMRLRIKDLEAQLIAANPPSSPEEIPKELPGDSGHLDESQH